MTLVIEGKPLFGEVVRHVPMILAPAVHNPGPAQGFKAAHLGRDEALRVERDLLVPGDQAA